MELFDKINGEHDVFSAQMNELVGSDPVSRRKQVLSLNAHILAHQKAEEDTIYEAFKQLDGVPRDLAMLRCEEHHVHCLLIKELEDPDLDDDRWSAKLRVLKFMYEHHADSEEKELYDMAVDYFTDDEIKDMMTKYEQVEARLFEAVEHRPEILSEATGYGHR